MQLISKTMIRLMLAGKRNLGIEKAKIVAKKTGTDPLIWIDPALVAERKKAWDRAFPPKKRKVKK